MSSKRVRFIAIVIALAVVGLVASLWVNEEPLWRLVMTKRIEYETGYETADNVRGWYTERRTYPEYNIDSVEAW